MKFYSKSERTPKQTYSSEKPNRTRQSEADSADINKIMERFERTGKLPAMQTLPPQYGEPQLVSYDTALNMVRQANDQFNALPANTRKYFNHNPQLFLEAISNVTEENYPALKKLGIYVERQKTTDDLLTELVKNTQPQAGNSIPT